jgi:hypothetical protein
LLEENVEQEEGKINRGRNQPTAAFFQSQSLSR